MAYFSSQNFDNDFRRDELIRTLEYSLVRLSLPELEALYYDMLTKGYIRD